MNAPADSLSPRRFGRTELMVTPICIGGGPIGSMTETFGYDVPEAQALATVRAVLDGPINYLDTAAAYGDGESERRIGLALRERGGLPPGFVLATKADRNMQTGDFSGEQIKRSIERSQRLLGLDQLQLVFLHDPENASFEELTAPGGAVDVLLDYKAQGIIQHLGVAGGPIDLMIRYLKTGAFESVLTHNRYTLLNRAAAPLIDLAVQHDLVVINAAPYNSGILAKGPQEYPRFVYHDAPAATIERAQRMASICEQHGVPLAAAALQFSLRDQRITSTIVGVSRPERVAQTIELARHPIPDALWPQLDAVGFDTADL
jgi:D-threo-aldose 1-dehydrogenase